MLKHGGMEVDYPPWNLEDENERRAAQRFERRLSWALTLLITFVALVQWAMRSSDVRRLLNESIRLEGLPLIVEVPGSAEPARPWLDLPPSDERARTGMLCLRVLGQSPGEAWILLNGTPIRTLPPEGAVVTVRDGDRVEVLSPGGEIGVLISSVSSDVMSPFPGAWARGSGRLEVCAVELK